VGALGLVFAFWGSVGQSELISLTQGEELARRFVQRARKGAFGQIAGTAGPLDLRQATLVDDGRQAAYDFGSAGVRVDRRQAAVTVFHESFSGIDPTWRADNALASNQLSVLANEIYVAAGFSGPLIMYSIDSHGRNGPEGSYCLHLLPTYAGVPFTYDSAVTIIVEHATGRVYTFTVWNRPDPPDSLTPGIGLSIARVLASEAVFRYRPAVTQIFEKHPVRLAIWRPRLTNGGIPDYARHSLAETQLARARQGKGLLVYWTYLHDFGSYRGEMPQRAYEVFLDASDGRALAIDALEAGQGGGTFRHGNRSNPFSWDLGLGPIEISRGRKRCVVEAADVMQCSAPRSKVVGKEFVLRRARLAVFCQFDAASGVLWTTVGKRRVFGKPNANLLNALRGFVR